MVPRFVYHIDEGSVSALTNYYKQSIQPSSAILDICSSWVSHYPTTFPSTMSTIKGSGLNKVRSVHIYEQDFAPVVAHLHGTCHSSI